MKYLLMIPGPVEIPEDILEHISAQPVAHYGPEWARFYLETAESVSRLLSTKGRTFIMPGSGSLGLDTVGASFCREKRCLVLHNGQFGQRLYDIISKYTSHLHVLTFPLQAPVDPDVLKRSLQRERYDVILMTHVETSTGILNPAEEVGKIAQDHGLLLILDAISSVGIERLEMDDWSIGVTVTASQKGLECPPGLALVTVQSDLMERAGETAPNSWYTNLATWIEYYEKWHEWHPYPVTLPTSIICALAASVRMIEAEGTEKRCGIYRDVSRRLRNALTALGLEPFAPEECYAHGLTAISTKGKFIPSQLITFLKEKLEIQITGSFGEIANRVFRIGHMSRKQCRYSSLLRVVNGIALFMMEKGLKISCEEALRAFI
jgi:aspartate aminotransferase-like enzyme